ncbi:hypothetical protein BD410DRAFT_901809 [Rickenella mellea]|uniref:F-box domain-containing protein n=1 Tax=Rickenella mellea TaxID=50990 RepID=A0A4Y7PQI2_9AGAM|nr:hypothetical protein BD410DRAFT_901809 [Rickenella mellea]
MHLALAIPEILDIILNSTDELANARAVSVCKTWSGVARDTLWRDVCGLRRLFTLLAPMERTYHTDYRFCREIEPNDWIKFNDLASRVKHLTVEDSRRGAFCIDALGEVATTRQTFHILPNITQLTLTTSDVDEFRFSAIFLHQDLQRLVLEIPVKAIPKHFFAEITLRCAKLCYLDLQITSRVLEAEAELTDMLSTLTNLKTVVMRGHPISSSIVSSLSRIPNLGTIKFEYFSLEYFSHQRSRDPADVQPLWPVLREGAFPSLKDISCYSTLRHIASFFSAQFAPLNITSLYVHTMSIETPNYVSEYLKVLSQTCTMLKSVVLCLIMGEREHGQNGPVHSDSISFQDIYPILDFLQLTSFKLTHYRPLDITDDDIDRLASHWPLLESLELNTQPVALNDPKLTFASLASLARHCPNLTHLGLYVNPSPTAFQSPQCHLKSLIHWCLERHRFRKEIMPHYISVKFAHYLVEWRLEYHGLKTLSLASWKTTTKCKGDGVFGRKWAICCHCLSNCGAKREDGEIWTWSDIVQRLASIIM